MTKRRAQLAQAIRNNRKQNKMKIVILDKTMNTATHADVDGTVTAQEMVANLNRQHGSNRFAYRIIGLPAWMSK